MCGSVSRILETAWCSASVLQGCLHTSCSRCVCSSSCLPARQAGRLIPVRQVRIAALSLRTQCQFGCLPGVLASPSVDFLMSRRKRIKITLSSIRSCAHPKSSSFFDFSGPCNHSHHRERCISGSSAPTFPLPHPIDLRPSALSPQGAVHRQHLDLDRLSQNGHRLATQYEDGPNPTRSTPQGISTDKITALHRGPRQRGNNAFTSAVPMHS